MLKLPVLLYNKAEPELHDDFVYRLNYLRDQLKLLVSNGYTSITCSQLIDHLETESALPEKPVLLTFDGCHLVNFSMTRLLLMEYDFKATFFIAGETVLKSTCGEAGYREEYMQIEQVRQLHKEGFELALQGYSHVSNQALSPQAIKGDIEKNITFCRKFELPFAKAVASPLPIASYRYLRTDSWQEIMRQLDIQLGFHRGSRVNRLPRLNRYTIERIPIDRHDVNNVFARKLRGGIISWFW